MLAAPEGRTSSRRRHSAWALHAFVPALIVRRAEEHRQYMLWTGLLHVRLALLETWVQRGWKHGHIPVGASKCPGFIADPHLHLRNFKLRSFAANQGTLAMYSPLHNQRTNWTVGDGSSIDAVDYANPCTSAYGGGAAFVGFLKVSPPHHEKMRRCGPPLHLRQDTMRLIVLRKWQVSVQA